MEFLKVQFLEAASELDSLLKGLVVGRNSIDSENFYIRSLGKQAFMCMMHKNVTLNDQFEYFHTDNSNCGQNVLLQSLYIYIITTPTKAPY